MDDLISRNAIEHLVMTKSYDLGEPIQKRLMMHDVESLPSAQPELIESMAYVRGFEQGRTQGMIDSQGGQK